MKFLQKKSVLTIYTLCIVCSTQAANAAYNASSTINWNDLNVRYVDLSGGLDAPQLSWTSQYGYSASESHSEPLNILQSDIQDADDFTTSLSTSASTPNSQSSAIRDTAVLQANASTDEVTGYNYSSGHAYNVGNFSLSGNGYALITLPWSQSMNGGTLLDYNNYTQAYTYIYGSFDDANGNSGSATTYVNSVSSDNNSANRNGTFALAAFSDGTRPVSGNLYAQTYAYTVVSTVPDPATAWLFSSGLMAVMGYTRRKNRV